MGNSEAIDEVFLEACSWRLKNAKNTRGSEVLIQSVSGDLSFYEVGGVPLGFLRDFLI